MGTTFREQFLHIVIEEFRFLPPNFIYSVVIEEEYGVRVGNPRLLESRLYQGGVHSLPPRVNNTHPLN